MINVTLAKTDVINLLLSVCPPYEKIEEFEKKGLGAYSGGFNDKWTWNKTNLEKMSIEALYDIYLELKNEEEER